MRYVTNPLEDEIAEVATHKEVGWNNFMVIRDMERFVDAVQNIPHELDRIAEALENQKN